MRHPETSATWLAGPAMLALLIAPATTTAQQTTPAPAPAGRPAIAPRPATTGIEEIPQRTPAPVAAPGTPEESPEDQEQQDRLLAESQRNAPDAPDPAGVNVSIPQGWIRIAIDLDGDGTFDAIETINADALNQARRMSSSLQMGGQPGMADPSQGMADPSQGMAGPQDLGELELSGTVREIREFRLSGLPSPHRIARVETEDGVAKVDLGAVDALGGLVIEEGDEIRVVGHRGMINDRPILMARQVTMGDQSAEVESPDDEQIKRVRGAVLGTRTASFRSRDEEHLIAEVELRGGDRAEVILGPKAKLGDLELSEGTEVSLLVRPARLNGRMAMAAEQVRVGDQAVAIREPVDEPVQEEPETDTETDADEDEEGRDAESGSLVPSLTDPAPGDSDS